MRVLLANPRGFCAGVDRAIDIVQRAIERSILQQRRLRASVTCPSQVLQRAGITFTCEAAVGGRRYPFSVTEVDNGGHVHYVGAR